MEYSYSLNQVINRCGHSHPITKNYDLPATQKSSTCTSLRPKFEAACFIPMIWGGQREKYFKLSFQALLPTIYHVETLLTIDI